MILISLLLNRMIPVINRMNVDTILNTRNARGRGWGFKNEDRNISITGVSGLSQKMYLYFSGIREAGYTTGAANMNKRSMNCVILSRSRYLAVSTLIINPHPSAKQAVINIMSGAIRICSESKCKGLCQAEGRAGDGQDDD